MPRILLLRQWPRTVAGLACVALGYVGQSIVFAPTLGCAVSRVESPALDGGEVCASTAPVPEIVCGTAAQLITLPYQEALLPIACTHALGSLHVPDPTSDILDRVRNLRRVDGRFSIFRPQALTDLQSVASLEVVGGEFSIDVGPIDGLGSLAGVGRLRELGALSIRRMSALTTLAPFRCLQTIHGDVVLEDNTALAQSEIEGFLSRVHVEGKTVTKNNAR
jgi:hypothetical protein